MNKHAYFTISCSPRGSIVYDFLPVVDKLCITWRVYLPPSSPPRVLKESGVYVYVCECLCVFVCAASGFRPCTIPVNLRLPSLRLQLFLALVWRPFCFWWTMIGSGMYPCLMVTARALSGSWMLVTGWVGRGWCLTRELVLMNIVVGLSYLEF